MDKLDKKYPCGNFLSMVKLSRPPADNLPMNEIERRKKVADLGLSAQQKRFCVEYVKDFDKTRAVKDAGYRGNRASTEVLRMDGIQEYIDILCEEIQERLKLSVDAILDEMKIIAFSNMQDFCTWTTRSITVKELKKIPKEKLPAIQEISDTANGVKIKLHNKMDALERLHKYVAAKKPKSAGRKTFNIQNAIFALSDPKTRDSLEHLAMKELNEGVEDSED